MSEQKLRDALHCCRIALRDVRYSESDLDIDAIDDALSRADNALSQPQTSDEGTPTTDYAVYYVNEEAHRLIFGEDGELCGEVVNAEVSRRLERALHAKERENWLLRAREQALSLEQPHADKVVETVAAATMHPAWRSGKDEEPSDEKTPLTDALRNDHGPRSWKALIELCEKLERENAELRKRLRFFGGE